MHFSPDHSTRIRRADSEEENRQNAGLEMQIQEIERAQAGRATQAGAGGQEEIEMEDSAEMGEDIMSKNSAFHFVAPHASRTMRWKCSV